MSRRLLITGATGFVGWNLCAAARGEWQAVALVRSETSPAPAGETLVADIGDPAAVESAFKTGSPDAVVHAAAMSKPADVELHPELSHRVNVEAPAKLAELSAERDIPFIFLSSGLVFDGTQAPYSEDAARHPVQLYGRQKAEAEALVLRAHPRACVCRLSWTFGPPAPERPSFVQPMLEALRNGDELTEFADVYSSPGNVRAVIQGLMLVLERGTGIYHLCGIDRVSRFELAQKLAEVFDLPPAKVKPRYRHEVNDGILPPPDTAMCISRARGLGYKPLPLDEELRLLRRQLVD